MRNTNPTGRNAQTTASTPAIPARPVMLRALVGTDCQYNREVIRGCLRQAHAAGARVQAWTREVRPDPQGIDGFLIVDQRREAILRVAAFGRPVVSAARCAGTQPVPSVLVDDAAAGEQLADHLLDRGHRLLHLIGGRQPFWRLRVAAIARRAAARGVQAIRIHEPADDARRLRWLRRLPRPAAVIAANDDAAWRLANLARIAGIAVPAEIAILGADDERLYAEVADPPLSSLAIPAQEIGVRATALLLNLIAGAAPPTDPLLVKPAGVITRASTDLLCIDDAPLRAALALADAHATRPDLSVDHLAAAAGLPRRTFELRFRNQLGRSPWQHIIDLRLQRAQRLLRDSDLTLGAIAAASGFGARQRLNRVWKERFGTAPGAVKAATDPPDPWTRQVCSPALPRH